MPKPTAPKTEPYVTRARRTEFQTRTEGEDLIIEGYFVVFNQPFVMDEWSEEVVCTGAFDGCDMSDVRALVDHLSHLVLGRSTAQTLTFQIDDIGLFATIRINARDTDAMNLYARVQRGDVTQCSFGFDIIKEEFEEFPDGSVRWTLREVLLYEVSVVCFPAYSETSVTARQQDLETIRRRELELRRARLKEKIESWH